MSELGTVVLENLASRHEVGLSDLFCALRANDDGNFFYPHPLTSEEARKLCRCSGLDQYFVATVNGRILGYGMLRGWDEGYAIPSLGLATHPDARSQGLGEFLMRGLIRGPKSKGSATPANRRCQPIASHQIICTPWFCFQPIQTGQAAGYARPSEAPMMAVASGNLEFGKTSGEGTAVGAMSLIRCGFQCDPRVVYTGLPARKIANRSNAMLEMEAPLLAETQGQR